MTVQNANPIYKHTLVSQKFSTSIDANRFKGLVYAKYAFEGNTLARDEARKTNSSVWKGVFEFIYQKDSIFSEKFVHVFNVTKVI